MIEVFKILHNIYDSEISLLLEFLNYHYKRTFTAQPPRLEIRRNSFAVRVVKPWNSLAEEFDNVTQCTNI